MRDLTVKTPSFLTYSLPSVQDDEKDTIRIQVILPNSIGKFVKYSSSTGLFTIEGAERYIGNYTVTVYLDDDNDTPLRSTY